MILELPKVPFLQMQRSVLFLNNIFTAKNNLNWKPFGDIGSQNILYNIDWKHFLRRFCLFFRQVLIFRTNFYGASAGQSI